MISERDAKRLYPRDTKVVRKGDREWKSDAGPELELAERVPGLESDILTRSTHRPRYHHEDPYLEDLPSLDGIEVGTMYGAECGRDIIWYEARATGWHRRYKEKNGAL